MMRISNRAVKMLISSRNDNTIVSSRKLKRANPKGSLTVEVVI